MRLLYMSEGRSWTTANGVDFTKDHPYQLVDEGEAKYLLMESKFQEATREDIIKFYKLEERDVRKK